MTRYTNVARKKRTYLEAGFEDDIKPEDREPQTEQASTIAGEEAQPSQIPPPPGPAKKKRKRGKSRKHLEQNEDGANGAPAGGEDEKAVGESGDKGAEGTGEETDKNSVNRKNRMKAKRLKDAEARKMSSERRRLKRRDDRTVDTICFACREKGHAARECTKAIASDTIDENQSRSAKSGKAAVGICYRCGSRKHNLSRCPLPTDSSNPLPFASCFVCSGKGHLASSCPQNQSKGIYPNGGCCKLCGETTHLAKNCTLRKPEVIAAKLLLGTGDGAGADEDDFHSFKRKNAQVDKEVKSEERFKKRADVKVGAHSGLVKSFGSTPAAVPKKVVSF